MSDTAQSWLKVLGASGVVALLARGVGWLVGRPLKREERARDRAEREADYWRGKYLEVATELKANTAALLKIKRAAEIEAGAPPESLPPMRDEMPTLQCFVEGPPAREWAERRASSRPRQIVETYAPGVRPTDPAPPDYPEPEPVALAPPFPPRNAPRGRRGR